jgi:hypothetical protein
MGKHISVVKPGRFKKFGHDFQFDKFNKFNNVKLYLAEITFKDTKEVFHKFGVTSKMDAALRFVPSEYQPNFNMFEQPVRVLASAILPVKKAFEWEKYFQDIYPKNIHIKEYFNGISEAVLLNKYERFQAIKKIMSLNKLYKSKRLKALYYS